MLVNADAPYPCKESTGDDLLLAGRSFYSRLMVGTGKYVNHAQTRAAIDASGTQVVTVALRRVNIGQRQNDPNLLDALPAEQFTILPNTAGCYNVGDAVRTCQLARELLNGAALVKLEVLGDQKTLYPNVVATIQAAQQLVDDGFQVMAYTNDDPIVAQELESCGCIAVMPLAAPIGSGLGICNPHALQIILENAKVPIIVDAGIGTASDAALAMELGCAGVLLNTAIAGATNPIAMAQAMKHAVIAGRLAFLAGRMPKKRYASASSPLEGVLA